MIVYFSHFLDQNVFFIVFIVENVHDNDVIVRTNISGNLEVDYLKPKAILSKSKNLKTKTSLSVSAVDSSTGQAIEINGQSVIHLEPTTSDFMTLEVLTIRGTYLYIVIYDSLAFAFCRSAN